MAQQSLEHRPGPAPQPRPAPSSAPSSTPSSALETRGAPPAPDRLASAADHARAAMLAEFNGTYELARQHREAAERLRRTAGSRGADPRGAESRGADPSS